MRLFKWEPRVSYHSPSLRIPSLVLCFHKHKNLTISKGNEILDHCSCPMQPLHTHRRQVQSIWKKLSIEFQNGTACVHHICSSFWREADMGLKCSKYIIQFGKHDCRISPTCICFEFFTPNWDN